MFFIHILWIRGGGPRKWISERGGGSADVDNFLFYNIIIKCQNVDRGGPAKWIRFFLHFEAFSMVF